MIAAGTVVGNRRRGLEPGRGANAFRWLAFPVLLAALAPVARAAETDLDSPPMRVGFSSQLFVDVNESDARAALKVWAKTMGAERNIRVDPNISILVGTDAIAAFLKNAGDAVTLTAVELWKVRQQVPIWPTMIVGRVGGELFQEYVLLVHRDNPAAQLSDLRGRRLLVQGAAGGTLAELWLEGRLLEEKLGAADTFWGKTVHSGKLARVVLPVFFRQADACVVTREGFRTMVELNPQVGKQLKVVAQSPRLVGAPFCFRAEGKLPNRDRLIADANQVSTTVTGRQTLALFQTSELVARPFTDIDETMALLDRHEELLREYRRQQVASPGEKGEGR